MTTVLIIVLVAAAVVGLAAVVLRSRTQHSSVDSFRRQIDALGPEARRNVVDQVNNATEHDTTERETSDGSDEGGTRGT